MTPDLRNAVVAAEDRTFWTNHGIDPKGIIRAAFNDARGGATQGASTITQQYVKILYLTQERSVNRKVHEAILSLKLQKQLSKQEILQGYLNTIYFGRGAYGVQAAAQAYFGVDAEDLTLRQSARAGASVLNNPSQFDPANGKSHKEALLDALPLRARRHGLDEARSPQAAGDRGRASGCRRSRCSRSPAYGGQKGHMLSLVRQELHQLGFTDDQIDGGGLRVTTTFTPKAMAAAKAGVVAVRPKHQRQAAPRRGRPRCSPAAARWSASSAARTTCAPRSTGPRPAAWSARPSSRSRSPPAITDGYSLKSTWDGNSPYVVPRRSRGPQRGSGAGHDYGSAVRSVLALEQSINTAFVDLSIEHEGRPRQDPHDGQQDGDPAGRADPQYPGIPSSTRDLEPDALITLGKSRVSAINMANTYATIANGGQRADVHVDQQGDAQRRHREVPVQAAHARRRSTPTSTATSATRCSRSSCTAPAPTPRRSTGPPPARPVRRPTTPRPGVVVVVRRLHPAAVHRGDVRARQGQRRARRLAAAVQRGRGLLRRRLPDGHVDRGDEGATCSASADRAVPAAGQRPGQAERPRAGPDPAARHARTVAAALGHPTSSAPPSSSAPTRPEHPRHAAVTDVLPAGPLPLDHARTAGSSSAPPPTPAASRRPTAFRERRALTRQAPS